jgi:hypothetical protein
MFRQQFGMDRVAEFSNAVYCGDPGVSAARPSEKQVEKCGWVGM